MLFIVLFLLLEGVWAHGGGGGAPYEGYPQVKRDFSACTSQLGYLVTFCGPDSPYDYYSCACGNENYRASLMGCLHVNDRDTPEKLKKIADLCGLYGVPLEVSNLTESYQFYLDNAVDMYDIPDFDYMTPVDVPIKVNETEAKLYAASTNQFLGNYNDSLYYGVAILGYWLLVLIIGGVCNWARFLVPGFVKTLTGPVSTFMRKHFISPALHRKRTDAKPMLKILDCLVPSRLESLIITGFLAMIIGCLAANIRTVPNDPTFTSKSESLGRQIAVRSGIMTSCYMPLLILFAGRNNFLQWVTKWNFATFITFHRWVGRMAFIMVAIHGIGYSISFSAYYLEYMKDTYVVWGMIATVAGGLIIVQGLLVLRRKWYEMFLLIHIILAALFVGGAWIHVDELGYVWFYYATSAVWIFDRVIRFARLLVFGFPVAEVQLSCEETVKVVVPKPKHWKSQPGGHAFVHFLRPSCFWQSHPFTFTESVETDDKITLYCKVKGGVTHGLYQHLMKHPGRSTKIRVAVEGPYGESTPAKYYDSAVFVAGGNGIPGIYSEAYDIALKSMKNKDQEKGQTIKLMWIIRDHSSIEWFYDELQFLRDKPILPIIYVTKPVLEQEDISSDEKIEKKDSTSKAEGKRPADIEGDLDHVEFRYGRPDINQIVRDEIKESSGSTAFITCGHPIMVDDLRHYVCENIGEKRVDFFEQLQVWA